MKPTGKTQLGGEGTQLKRGPSEGKPQACNIDELLCLGSGSPGVCTAPRPAGTQLLASDACLIAELEELSRSDMVWVQHPLTQRDHPDAFLGGRVCGLVMECGQ